jgi:hypothetical protein
LYCSSRLSPWISPCSATSCSRSLSPFFLRDNLNLLFRTHVGLLLGYSILNSYSVVISFKGRRNSLIGFPLLASLRHLFVSTWLPHFLLIVQTNLRLFLSRTLLTTYWGGGVIAILPLLRIYFTSVASTNPLSPFRLTSLNRLSYTASVKLFVIHFGTRVPLTCNQPYVYELGVLALPT